MLVRFGIIAFYAIGVLLFGAFVQLVDHWNRWRHAAADFVRFAEPLQTYDFIIVGGGTAGLNVAAALSEHFPAVLLLEAGDSEASSLPFDIPLLTPLLQRTAFDYGQQTVPQAHACGALDEQRSRWPLGRGIGGSQILNYMLWTRGHRDDFRGWFDAPEHYDYPQDVGRHFDAAERLIGLQQLPHRTPLADGFLRASQQFGYAPSDFQLPNVTQTHGQRRTAAGHAESRARYETIGGARVRRVLFDGAGRTAIGVAYERSGQTRRVHARLGVILSAGTIGSPLLLADSGVDDLPALGAHLQDHVATGVDLLLVRESLGVRPWQLLTLHTLQEFIANGTGPLTMCGCEALGFVRSNDDDGPPDIGFMVLPVGPSADGGSQLRHLLNLDESVWQRYFRPLIGQQTASIVPIVLHPRSRGTVRRDANGQVLIDPQYLSDATDVDVLVRGLRIVQQLLEMPAMRDLGVELNPMPFPGCEAHAFASDAYWRCYVRELTLTAFHPVGTCRMGVDAAESVVDRRFRVHGRRRLWVTDASVMPRMPSGNPNAAVAMLAHRCANGIIADERKRNKH